MSEDTIFIKELTVHAIIGIYDWERQIKQRLVFDIEMGTDIAKAAASDDIKDTLNYKAVAKRVIQFAEESEFGLIESLIERVAGIILAEFPTNWVRITLNKVGAVRGSKSVGIRIERH
ncbi:MAG: dihydroneopterin aldolase [Gammaproteobacteria bacterium]|nr:dihydroneopterin aldolase [Gammaproteobacteria bacterium]NNC96633.1 dihydroneopterin aldolase [Gammaproteobacteria bacterium]NNM12971.1 dihydroneopterin aldolase [Gammaproteobacteria bacterium]